MLSRTTLHHRPSSRQLLARVLDAPELAPQVRALPGALLGRLIDHVGLEDAAELVALASTEQLSEIFDHELWQSTRPGEDERFDSERFLTWLEIMLEGGERCVAEHLAELPQELLTLALQRHLLVVRLVDLQRELTADDDEAAAAEKAFESCLSEELDDYQLIWRGGDGWDSVLAALLALDREHHGLVVDLLERCAELAREQIDDGGGLYAVLSSEDMLEADLAAERETRRAAEGYVAPSAARAFLRLALNPSAELARERDALTRAYFRDLERDPRRRLERAPEPPAVAPRRELRQLLDAAGITVTAAAPKLPGGRAQPPLFTRALRQLAARNPSAFAARSEELAYLANVLLAGASLDGRRLRPAEAVEHALLGVRVGLSALCQGRGQAQLERACELLVEHGCDMLLRVGFARALESARAPAAGGDRESVRELSALLGRLAV